mgnify:FL=1
MVKKMSLKVKRSFDIIAALGGIIIFLPLFIVSALLIKIKLGSPILFRQKRIGKDNKEFELIKFRTMKNTVDKNGENLPDEKRITKFGSKLRSLSIDELPELINILRGEMSLIGPRPLLPQYIPLYNENQIRRHEVMPGLTGYAQVNGRNNLSWHEKFKLDVYYVDNWSLKLDIKIFFMTFYKILKREGINKKDHVTTEYFNGDN